MKRKGGRKKKGKGKKEEEKEGEQGESKEEKVGVWEKESENDKAIFVFADLHWCFFVSTNGIVYMLRWLFFTVGWIHLLQLNQLKCQGNGHRTCFWLVEQTEQWQMPCCDAQYRERFSKYISLYLYSLTKVSGMSSHKWLETITAKLLLNIYWVSSNLNPAPCTMYNCLPQFAYLCLTIELCTKQNGKKICSRITTCIYSCMENSNTYTHTEGLINVKL